MSRQIRVTVPDNIYKQLEEAAKNNYRSLSNQCLIMLRDGLQYQQLLNPPQFVPHNTPGGITTTPTPTPTLEPPFEPYATASVPAVSPAPEPQPAPSSVSSVSSVSSMDQLLNSIEEHKKELSTPSAHVKFIRPDGEPFELKDFEKFLPEDTRNDDTYHTLKKHIPSLQLTTILREGATRSLDDFIKYLKEDYLYTLENALGYSINQSMSSNTLRKLASYLQPNVPDEYKK